MRIEPLLRPVPIAQQLTLIVMSPTHSMKRSPSSEADSRLSAEGIPRLL
jgi:hypothetical protein